MPVDHAPTPAVDVRGLTFDFNGTHVLDGVTFSLAKGSFTALLGPNGGGKTTLLKLLAGLWQPRSGDIRIFGLAPRAARAGGRIGYVPQRIAQSALEFPATVSEVVRDGTTPSSHRLCDCAVHSGQAAATEAMREAGILHLRDRTLAQLSGGERQRVFIARAIASSPDILMLDEPTAAVDARSQVEFYETLKRLNARGVTIIIVSHDVDAVSREVDSVLCLNKTVAVQCKASEARSHDMIERLYGAGTVALHHHHS